MKCKDFRTRLNDWIGPDSDPSSDPDWVRHGRECPDCGAEFKAMRTLAAALTPSHRINASSGFKERVMNHITEIENAADLPGATTASPAVGIVRSRWTGRILAAGLAACLLLAAVAALYNAGGEAKNRPALSPFTLLAQASEVLSTAKVLHIQCRMRTLPHDNFSYVNVKEDFVPIDIWRQQGEPRVWRVEKPGRVVLWDGTQTIQIIRSPAEGAPPMAVRFPAEAGGLIGICLSLVNVETLLNREQTLADKGETVQSVSIGKQADGGRTIDLRIESSARGDFSQSDYTRNTSIAESDHARVYSFDAETKRLLTMQVLVRTGETETPVFEVTGVDCDALADPAIFTLDLPDNVLWATTPEEQSAGKDSSAMTPDQVARAFFEAMAAENWDGARIYGGIMADHPMFRKYLAGSTLVSLGKPFKSGLYPGWFVPYELLLANGETKKHNLAVRNDNPKKQWSVDGGI